MKVIYTTPTLILTNEEIKALEAARTLLEDICDKVEDFSDCKQKCPIYEMCPYHNNMKEEYGTQLHSLLENIKNIAREEETK